ncbi:MAG: hypothetical protein M1820_009444 [Bogoriella megaspora]|nr:MAG: hypothetical protein M1820_009444 [Bogoriella megaspora]
MASSTTEEVPGPSKSNDSPDIMNDPAYATNTEKSEKGSEDVDTCRICRGEGTEDEPLFYPCKCSGSIKFVHQDCLMEWLSHSHKKHCELCKTPFRFTKLYHPHMPESIPTTVFLHRAAIHCMRQFLTWCRGFLVVFVWLLWLPWCMRFVWRGLFWIGDGGWAQDLRVLSSMDAMNRQLTEALAQVAQQGSHWNGTILRDSNNNMTGQISPPARSSGSRNYNISEEPLSFTFFKRVFDSVLQQPGSKFTPGNLTNSTSFNTSVPRSTPQIQPSLLSGIPLFNSLTPSPSINRLVLDVLEGQIITLLVLVAFILIFLIREWVVQQQPVINMAAINAVNAGQEQLEGVGENADDATDAADDEEEDDELEAAPSAASDDSSGDSDSQSEDLQSGEVDAGLPPSEVGSQDSSPSMLDPKEESSRGRRFSDPGTRPRPRMPLRDQSSVANAVIRGLEESGKPPSTSKDEGNRTLQEDAFAESQSEESNESWQNLSIPEDGKQPSSSSVDHETAVEMQQASHERRLDSLERKTNSPVVLPEENDSTTAVRDEESEISTRQSRGIPGSEPDQRIRHPSNMPQSDFEQDPADIPELAPEQLEQEPVTEAPLSENRTNDAHKSFLDRLFDWLWGDAAPVEAIPPAPVQDLEEVLRDGEVRNDNFVPVIDGHPAVAGNHREGHEDQDPEVLAAAQQAGIDPDPAAVEDAEDLEGIMELIGMQGPVIGLIQNAMFGAFLISATVAGAVWFPYLWGKLVILFIGSPVLLLVQFPIALAAGATALIADTCLFFAGSIIHWATKATRLLFLAMGWGIPVFDADYEAFNNIADFGRSIGEHALGRIASLFITTGFTLDSDFVHMSLRSHLTLRAMQNEVRQILSFVVGVVLSLCRSLAQVGIIETVKQASYRAPELIQCFVRYGVDWLGETYESTLSLLKMNISTTPQVSIIPEQLDPSLAYWSASDRLLAVMAGYGCFALIGALYLRRGVPFTSSHQGRKVEAMVTEMLQQAGGVMKVIFIISIEMIVFPLYCGVLLDLALLPLCENATVLSRVDWSLESPWTSGFVHWFIGTCYMFHFALFVSMCRKIMRNGVLYFIRDPDDPTFHPVRDVLERNVSTQLRKITFSALIYGGLVIVCLGGVVWSLTYSFDNVLPIRWSANEPFFEFPIDLLLYNFFVPVIIKALQPSQVLHTTYEWWFRRCARALRLSQFLFGERHSDEEGRDLEKNWFSFVFRITAKSSSSNNESESSQPRNDQAVNDFVPNGRYVRAPASDQVRIPKGSDVFLEVNEKNERVDGQPDQDEGLHGRKNKQFEMVYIPPWFRARIGLFIGCLWVFAAATGISVTIMPLVFGRRMFDLFLSDASRINDVYAFCFGLYTLGGLAYLSVKGKGALLAIKRRMKEKVAIPSELLQQFKVYGLRALKCVYTYSAFATLVPCIFALGLELYLILPLHSYVQLTHRVAAANPSALSQTMPNSSALTNSSVYSTVPNLLGNRTFIQSVQNITSFPLHNTVLSPHVLHILQSWTLGLIYFRLTLRVLLALPTARAGRALRAVVRRGWWDPDVWLATRGFVLPLLVIATIIIGGPPLIAGSVIKVLGWMHPHNARFIIRSATLTSGTTSQVDKAIDMMSDEEAMAVMYRFSYPVTLTFCLGVWGSWGVVKALGRWRRRIRDEVYLVGERLHNFGEAKLPVQTNGARRASVQSAATNVEGAEPRPAVDLPRAGEARV